jgi:NAD-dependent SIR2 family protein deacetylase
MKCIQCYKETKSKLDMIYYKLPLCDDCKRLTESLRGTWGIPFPEAVTLKDEDIMEYGFK